MVATLFLLFAAFSAFVEAVLYARRGAESFRPELSGILANTVFTNNGMQTRRPYTTTDLRHIRAHYKDCTAAELAQQLGRTVGSLKRFIQARPELHKASLQRFI